MNKIKYIGTILLNIILFIPRLICDAVIVTHPSVVAAEEKANSAIDEAANATTRSQDAERVSTKLLNAMVLIDSRLTQLEEETRHVRTKK